MHPTSSGYSSAANTDSIPPSSVNMAKMFIFLSSAESSFLQPSQTAHYVIQRTSDVLFQNIPWAITPLPNTAQYVLILQVSCKQAFSTSEIPQPGAKFRAAEGSSLSGYGEKARNIFRPISEELVIMHCQLPKRTSVNYVNKMSTFPDNVVSCDTFLRSMAFSSLELNLSL